ncbi:unnamed protein product [Amoebophrya sp. A25]|nr:unnamed protein product [Amoebophrya sp. A25]|eukprot:GSA25T00023484001.1
MSGQQRESSEPSHRICFLRENFAESSRPSRRRKPNFQAVLEPRVIRCTDVQEQRRSASVAQLRNSRKHFSGGHAASAISFPPSTSCSSSSSSSFSSSQVLVALEAGRPTTTTTTLEDVYLRGKEEAVEAEHQSEAALSVVQRPQRTDEDRFQLGDHDHALTDEVVGRGSSSSSAQPRKPEGVTLVSPAVSSVASYCSSSPEDLSASRGKMSISGEVQHQRMSIRANKRSPPDKNICRGGQLFYKNKQAEGEGDPVSTSSSSGGAMRSPQTTTSTQLAASKNRDDHQLKMSTSSVGGSTSASSSKVGASSKPCFPNRPSRRTTPFTSGSYASTFAKTEENPLASPGLNKCPSTSSSTSSNKVNHSQYTEEDSGASCNGKTKTTRTKEAAEAAGGGGGGGGGVGLRPAETESSVVRSNRGGQNHEDGHFLGRGEQEISRVLDQCPAARPPIAQPSGANDEILHSDCCTPSSSSSTGVVSRGGKGEVRGKRKQEEESEKSPDVINMVDTLNQRLKTFLHDANNKCSFLDETATTPSAFEETARDSTLLTRKKSSSFSASSRNKKKRERPPTCTALAPPSSSAGRGTTAVSNYISSSTSSSTTSSSSSRMCVGGKSSSTKTTSTRTVSTTSTASPGGSNKASSACSSGTTAASALAMETTTIEDSNHLIERERQRLQNTRTLLECSDQHDDEDNIATSEVSSTQVFSAKLRNLEAKVNKLEEQNKMLERQNEKLRQPIAVIVNNSNSSYQQQAEMNQHIYAVTPEIVKRYPEHRSPGPLAQPVLWTPSLRAAFQRPPAGGLTPVGLRMESPKFAFVPTPRGSRLSPRTPAASAAHSAGSMARSLGRPPLHPASTGETVSSSSTSSRSSSSATCAQEVAQVVMNTSERAVGAQLQLNPQKQQQHNQTRSSEQAPRLQAASRQHGGYHLPPPTNTTRPPHQHFPGRLTMPPLGLLLSPCGGKSPANFSSLVASSTATSTNRSTRPTPSNATNSNDYSSGAGGRITSTMSCSTLQGEGWNETNANSTSTGIFAGGRRATLQSYRVSTGQQQSCSNTTIKKQTSLTQLHPNRPVSPYVPQKPPMIATASFVMPGPCSSKLLQPR